jgi:HME family heavy-metal exporter
VRAQIALKIYGDDLDTLRGLAAELRARLAQIPGVTDLQIEKQVLIPQVKIHLDYEQAARYGVAPGNLLRSLEQMIEGERITEIVEGNPSLRPAGAPAGKRARLQALADLLIETPTRARAAVESRAASRKAMARTRSAARTRGAVSCSRQTPTAATCRKRSPTSAAHSPPNRYPMAIYRARRAVPGAGGGGAADQPAGDDLADDDLHGPLQPLPFGALTLIIMGNIPLALVGSVIALWISGQPLSVAALVGFITLTGIATRNGILKISHYINLCAFEGETFGQHMIVRGSLERLTPVLMTALVAAFALLPLLLSADAPGKEVLHPVAVVIFGGLISSTLLDSLLTPLMFWLWGKPALQRLLAAHDSESF